MKIPMVVLLLQIAAILHLGLFWAGATMPRTVGLASHLAPLPEFIRRLFYVYFGFIALVLGAFGVMTFLYAGPMAAGDPVARGLALFMAVFWAVRLAAAVFVFDVRPYLQNIWLRLGYAGLNGVFLYLLGIYLYVGIRGGAV